MLLFVLVATFAPRPAAAGTPVPPYLGQWGGLGTAPGQLQFAHHFAVTAAGDRYVDLVRR